MLLKKNELYMQRCLELAKRGLGTVAPNPLVGALLVADEKIIGEGWHQMYGQAHAEVNAIQSVQENNKHLISKATLYVNLEPCNHFGKTPPCVDIILKHNIRKVIVANVDSNPLVGGKGIKRLTENGVQVTTGLLEQKARNLNKRFFTFIEKKRPYIILKWAQTKDGFLAKSSDEQTWITNQISKRLVHKWRSEEAAILVGTTTAKTDNPQLTNRYFEAGKQPLRIVIDRELSVPKTHFLLSDNHNTLIVNEQQNYSKNNLQYCQFIFDKKLIIRILSKLTELNVQSIIIEGGAATLQSFFKQNLWDEARILTGNKQFTEGIPAPKVSGKEIENYFLKNDQIQIIKNQKCTI